MRWWGWGEDGHDAPLPEHAVELLRGELGIDPAAGAPPVALEEVQLPESRLDGAVRARLAVIVGEERVLDDRAARVGHAAGRSYPDLLRLRSGNLGHAPDAVVEPGSADEVRALLAECANARVAVVPFGGGTSVVGGVDPFADGFPAVIALDLRRMDRLLTVDHTSLTATFEGGLFGPEAERLLAAEGLTLGHFPQSFEFTTVGVWVATR